MMQSFLPTVILRHRRENLKKCSLRGLESRPDFHFFSYPKSKLPPLTGYILLALDAPPLSSDDANRGLFVLDATWRHAETMSNYAAAIPGLIPRSIPGDYRTAYPRRQDDCSDPERGLASIEAIYIAYKILGRGVEGLLDQYYWKDEFLKKNSMD
jgi:pre-rRNA-processing protein TSR3